MTDHTFENDEILVYMSNVKLLSSQLIIMHRADYVTALDTGMSNVCR